MGNGEHLKKSVYPDCPKCLEKIITPSFKKGVKKNDST
jgi:hypothetical protein